MCVLHTVYEYSKARMCAANVLMPLDEHIWSYVKCGIAATLRKRVSAHCPEFGTIFDKEQTTCSHLSITCFCSVRLLFIPSHEESPKRTDERRFGRRVLSIGMHRRKFTIGKTGPEDNSNYMWVPFRM